MLSGPSATISSDMSAGREPVDAARLERALARLQQDCELVGRITAVEEHRAAVRRRLELELGLELMRTLLSGLAPASAA